MRYEFDQENYRIESNKLTERQGGETSSCNNSGAKTLLAYKNSSLKIKDEIVQDRKISDQKHNEEYESNFFSVYIREDTLRSNKLPTPEKRKFSKLKEEPKVYKCEKCARTYKQKNNLSNHKKLECGAIPQFRCEFCFKQFKRKSHMIRHVDDIHLKTHVQTSQTRHNCDKCSRSYTWLKSLNQHKYLKHAEVKPQLFCDVCGHTTNMKSSLTKHITARHLK
ncbi:zinc finger protein 676-like [Belonocnema kinseyi]|uniref:zinc finger protein 676-like n=1 Tax=Belonocnema kinseyi TaxID=2817044 RepID=UPI00143D8495|nr:zinc finger protein 676-like [Belonocnema kinseyi]